MRHREHGARPLFAHKKVLRLTHVSSRLFQYRVRDFMYMTKIQRREKESQDRQFRKILKKI